MARLDYPGLSCEGCRAIELADGVKPQCVDGQCPVPAAPAGAMTALAARAMIHRLRGLVPPGEVLRLMGAGIADLRLLAFIEEEIARKGDESNATKH